jgi:hypothetical protein
MTGRSKGRGQTKCSPLVLQVGGGSGANDPHRKYLLLQNHGGGQDSNRVVAPVIILTSNIRRITIHLQHEVFGLLTVACELLHGNVI